jgi:E3 ubiquitin-protein ligase NEDD4
MSPQPGDCEIKVRRDKLFEDSYAEIMRQELRDFKRRLLIFKGKDGLEDEVPAKFVS